MISISKEEYLKLRLAYETLCLLENGGVDNWHGYHDSLYEYADESIDKIEERLTKEILGPAEQEDDRS